MLEALLDQGTVIVCTSNSPIIQLNRHGVHEVGDLLFLPSNHVDERSYSLVIVEENCRCH